MSGQMYIVFSLMANILLSKIILLNYINLMIASGIKPLLSQENMLTVFPLLLAGGTLAAAFTTIKKRKTWFDVGINALFPWFIVVFLYVCRCKPKVGLGILAVFAVCVFSVIVVTMHRLAHQPLRCRMKHMYYRSRRILFFFLLLIVVPIGAYIGIPQEKKVHFLRFAQNYRTVEITEPSFSLLDIPDEVRWKVLSAEQKLEYLQVFAEACFQELGVEKVTLYISDEMENKNMAHFNYQKNAIFINRTFLENREICSLRKAFHVTAHECCHVAQYQIIYSLMILEKAGFDYHGMPYYEEAIHLAEAMSIYNEDKETYLTYSANEMEVQAEAYADEKECLLAERYQWE